MIRLLAIACFAGLATPALSEPWDCAFSVECSGTDCTSIDLPAQVIAADHEGALFLTTPTADRRLIRLTPPGDSPASYAGADNGHLAELLTVTEDGQALLSIHGRDGPSRIVTLFGTCTRL